LYYFSEGNIPSAEEKIPYFALINFQTNLLALSSFDITLRYTAEDW